MNEVIQWLEAINIQVHKISERLPNYSDSAILVAAREVYEADPDVKPIHVFWRIKEKLKQIPDKQRLLHLDELANAMALIAWLKRPWYTRLFEGANEIEVW